MAKRTATKRSSAKLRKALHEDAGVPLRLVGRVERELMRLQPDTGDPVRTALIEQAMKWIQLLPTEHLVGVVPVLARHATLKEAGILNPGPPPGADSA